jgi:hypothetical protein
MNEPFGTSALDGSTGCTADVVNSDSIRGWGATTNDFLERNEALLKYNHIN